ncbi:hypothetical protein C8J56DRAFT_898983 [Mycena floridula]|nr:hypothetical protein C8J56DRAFT_898983 [Mycena floridula]
MTFVLDQACSINPDPWFLLKRHPYHCLEQGFVRGSLIVIITIGRQDSKLSSNEYDIMKETRHRSVSPASFAAALLPSLTARKERPPPWGCEGEDADARDAGDDVDVRMRGARVGTTLRRGGGEYAVGTVGLEAKGLNDTSETLTFHWILGTSLGTLRFKRDSESEDTIDRCLASDPKLPKFSEICGDPFDSRISSKVGNLMEECRVMMSKSDWTRLEIHGSMDLVVHSDPSLFVDLSSDKKGYTSWKVGSFKSCIERTAST